MKVTSRSRGRGSSILRSTRMRPGRADITNTRSARNTASRRSWVTRHDGDLARRMQVADHAPQLLAREGVERAERLVEHQQLRLVDQRAAERGALLHAARQLPRKFLAQAAEPDRGQQLFGARDIFGACAGGCRCGAAATISSGSSRFSSVVRHGSSVGAWNAMPAILTGLLHELARDLHGSLERELQPGRELHQRGLAAAGRADHRGEFAFARRRSSGLRPRGAASAAPAAVGVADAVERDERGHERAPARRTCAQFALRSAAGGRNEASKTSAAFGLAFLNS